MTDTSDTNPDASGHLPGGNISVPGVEARFVEEVLPLEAALMRFLQCSSRQAAVACTNMIGRRAESPMQPVNAV